jgi:DNA polymerase-3 subunit delta
MTPTEFTNKYNQIPTPIIFLQGEETYFLTSFFNHLKAQLPPELRKDSFINTDDINEAIANVNEVSLFGDKTIVSLNNPSFLTASSSLDVKEEKELLGYFENPNSDNIFVINSVGLKLDKRKKINKIIPSKTLVIDFDPMKPNEIIKFVLNKFQQEEIEIDRQLVEQILQRLNYQLNFLDSNLAKLFLYGKQNKITAEIINDLVDVNPNDDALTLADAVNKGQITKAIEIYRKLIDDGQTPIAINAFLISQYRLMIQIASSGYGNQEIASLLKKHPFRVEKVRELVNNQDFNSLVSKYQNLLDIDFKLKSTTIDPKLMFEMFVTK